MGNKLSYSCDDEHLRMSILCIPELEGIDLIPACEKIPTCKIKIFELLKTKIINIKVHNTNIKEFINMIEIQNVIEILKKNRGDHFVSNDIFYFGFGFEDFEKYLAFLKKDAETFNFRHEKQIKFIVDSLEILVKHGKDKNLFYYFKELTPITHLQTIQNDTSLTKNYIETSKFPPEFLLVNVKGGVSYYLIETINTNFVHHRIGGSIVGESSFKALMNLMTDYPSSDEAISEWHLGDNSRIDMTVEDIYGEGLTSLETLERIKMTLMYRFLSGLPKDIIASSFGKAVRSREGLKYDRKDLIRSLFTMIAINIGQMTWLHSEIEKKKDIVVVFSKMVDITFIFLFQCALAFYTNNEKNILFVECEEFLTTMNPLIKAVV